MYAQSLIRGRIHCGSRAFGIDAHFTMSACGATNIHDLQARGKRNSYSTAFVMPKLIGLLFEVILGHGFSICRERDCGSIVMRDICRFSIAERYIACPLYTLAIMD